MIKSLLYILTMNMERDPIAFLLEVMAVSQRRKTKTRTFVPTRHNKWRYKLKLLKSMETSFLLKVFSEHKPGGFVRLMEALDSLGLEVTNANVNSFRGLVSNVFKVEKKDSEMIQADHVRESLLELTRNPSKGLSEMVKASENKGGVECNY
ncbi:hypothetical protein HRI_000056400 [Hibiscus trionum]|uniref:Plant bHLH transcription factor ACT-like domain-containing protein n=1 Tax=Hibiscus trionum TaxID=183268 RepID=A0A9W7GS55_HIBTR|nr:hypothetical protein HRI_000056400 [Hibiscus trionum]